MDSEEEPEFIDDVWPEYGWPGYYGECAHNYDNTFYDIYGGGYGSLDEEEAPHEFTVGIARVPLILLQSIANMLRGRETLLRAWMLAVAKKFPDTSIGELRSKCPSLLPPWLLQRFAAYEDVLVLRHGGIFARRVGARPEGIVPSKSLSMLAATSECRFQEGFASEGMLCNNPPIPLRVLDFLEDTEDLLNLALVCKATHQAGHILLEREFPGGVGPGLVTDAARDEAIKRRKRSMLESALHQPSTRSTAPASTSAAAPEPEACAGADAGEADTLYENLRLAEQLNERRWVEVDWCMLVLSWAAKMPAAGPSARTLPQPSVEWLFYDGVGDEYRWALEQELQPGIVLDAKAVRRAIAHWAVLNVEADRNSGEDALDVERVSRVMGVLRAAARHGEGVIVHPRAFLDFSGRFVFD